MNMYIRYLTTKDVRHIRRRRGDNSLTEKEIKELLATELQARVLEDINNVEIREEEPEIKVTDEQLKQLGNEENTVEEVLPQINIKSAKTAVDEFTLLDESDVDDITVSQSIVTSPPTQQPMVMVMPLATAMSMNSQPIQTQLLQSQVPQAPPTLVVDTSEQAMKAQGLPTVQEEVKLRPILKQRGIVRAQSPSKKTTFAINKIGGEGDEGIDETQMSNNTKINIIKQE